MRNSLNNYENSSDEELIQIIQDTNDMDLQDFMITKYKKLVKIKSRTYFIIGADKEDIIQEGMIGLYKAIHDFNPQKNVSFYSFAELCITRQIITAIKAATRKKHSPLNSYISLNKASYESDFGTNDMTIETMIEGKILSPEELLIDRENKKYIESCMGKVLSELEFKVLSLYLKGQTYAEIATQVSRAEKSIDNAIQRIRKKVVKILIEKTS